MIDGRTIAALEAGGRTHIKAVCAGCGAIALNPFRLLRGQRHVTDDTTIAELRRRYRCQGCGARQATAFEAWNEGS